MSFYCPWQDGQFENCRRTGDTKCVPGKPGCVLHGKVAFAEDVPERTKPPRKRAKQVLTPSPDRQGEPFRDGLVGRLKAFPAALEDAIKDRTDWTTPLTTGGWTAAQIIHHLADVHSAGLARVRRALCETVPIVERYGHEDWSRLCDAMDPTLIRASLAILEGTHARWGALLAGLDSDAWSRAYRHPELGRPVSIEEDLAWHVDHGEMHLRRLR